VIIDNDGELIKWPCNDLKIKDMWEKVDGLEVYGTEFQYKDEIGNLLILYGDDDLNLMMRTDYNNLCFYLK
jgi:hypothetical protein